MFIGADGPCSISLNIGGKIFRAHHDEVNKGLISLSSLEAKKLERVGSNQASQRKQQKAEFSSPDKKAKPQL